MLNRRDLLKLFGVGATSVAIPNTLTKAISPGKASVNIDDELFISPHDEVQHQGGSTRLKLQGDKVILRDKDGNEVELKIGSGSITYREEQHFEYEFI